MNIRVLVADDQAIVRTGFRIILDGQPDMTVVGEAVDGADAVAAAARLRPDVVLMDVRMPRLDGIEATRQIVKGSAGEAGAAAAAGTTGLAGTTEAARTTEVAAAADVEGDPRRGGARDDGRDREPGGEGADGAAGRTGPAVLVVTTFELDEYVFGALHAGASGFLLKDISPEGLVDAIRTVHAGDSLIAPAVTRRLIEEFVRTHVPRSGPPRELAELTPRELDVLRLMAKGLTNAEIAAELFLGESTVKTHVGRILTKLDLRDRVQAVVLAYETGLGRPGG